MCRVNTSLLYNLRLVMENPQNLYELTDVYDNVEAEEKHNPEELYYERMSSTCTKAQKPAESDQIKKKLPYLQIVLLVMVLAVLVLILILQIGLYAGYTCGTNTVPLTGDSSILNNSPNCTCNNEKLTKLDKLLEIVQNISEQGNTMGTLQNNTALLLSDIVSSLSILNVLNDTSTSTGEAVNEVLSYKNLLTNISSTVSILHSTSTSTGLAVNGVKIAVDEVLSYKNLLTNIVDTLSILNDTSTSTAGTAIDVLQTIGELQSILLDLLQFKSCEDIKKLFPNVPSGRYNINDTNVYCHMGELCGSEGGWTRLAYLNMSDSTENCPSGFALYESGGVRACGRPYHNSYYGSCSSVQFPSFGISYSEICGRVIGYQFGSTDGDVYDSVTIYRGPLDQHVWTLMAGISDTSYYNCPCSTIYYGRNISSIVGTYYFCESGGSGDVSYILETSDPLWDGEGCGNYESPCCSAPGLPWFHRTYDVDTTDYITLKLCCDSRTTYEDIPIGFYEIYVK